MSLGILQAGILNIQGHEHKARSNLEAFAARTMDPWYLTISDYMLGNQTERSLLEQAGGDYAAFYARAAEIGHLPAGARARELRTLADGEPGIHAGTGPPGS